MLSSLAMATLEDRFCVREGGWWRRSRRDVALLAYLARLIWLWLVPGGRVRRAYRAKAAAGDVYWVDRPGGGP